MPNTVCPIMRDYPLAKLTRFGTGGTACCYAAPTSVEQLSAVVRRARDEGLPCCVLGGGTNILVSDAGVAGLVVKLSGGFKSIVFDDQRHMITAGAGTPLIKLGLEIARRNHEGCAYMGVIPGTVGGAVRMNAGIPPDREIRNHFVSAELFDTRTGSIIRVDANGMGFHYRSSMLAERPYILLSATFALPEHRTSENVNAVQEIRALFEKRRAKQPKNYHAFGSTFKNPGTQHSAGWYLERVGMKGMRIGGAMVADEHANWIVNIGGAITGDARRLIEIGHQRVFETFGIRLEREVVYVPEDVVSSAEG